VLVKKVIVVLLALSIPVLLSLEVWQVFRFRRLKEEVFALEEKQKDWLEENKKILANISLFSSPERIERLAEEVLDLEPMEPERVLTIKLPNRRGF
jgi:cell division protein FtsL